MLLEISNIGLLLKVALIVVFILPLLMIFVDICILLRNCEFLFMGKTYSASGDNVGILIMWLIYRLALAVLVTFCISVVINK